VAFQSVNVFLNRKGVVYSIRVEVLMANGTTWLDLTDRVAYDRLASLPGLQRRQTRQAGAAEVSLSSIVMDNSDRFWDKSPPAGIITWLRKQIRVSVVAPPAPVVLGVFLIEDLETATDSDVATLTVAGFSKRLVDKKADRVKNGRDWWTNKGVGWLIRQLLLTEFTVAEMQSWTGIAQRYKILLADTTRRAFSTYGRPPEYDGSVWREDGTTLYGNAYAVVNNAGAHYGKHWMGIGGALWKYNPDTDVWTLWCGMPAGRANFKIMHLYVNATRNKVIAVAWELDIPAPTYPTTTGHRSGAKNGDVAILYADMTTPPSVLQEFAGAPLNIYTGHYCVRAGRSSGGTTNVGAPGPAQLDANCAGLNIPVPAGYYSRATWLTAWSAGVPPHSKKKTACNVKTDSTEQGSDVTTTGSWRVDLPGFYAPFNPIPADPMDYRFTLGQYRGAFAHQNSGDSFVFCVVSWSGTTYRYLLWKLDTNTGAFTSTWGGATLYATVSTTEDFAPLSMVFRSDDAKLLVSGVRFRETAWVAGQPIGMTVRTNNEPYTSTVVEWTYPLTGAGPMPTTTGAIVNTNHDPVINPERFRVVYFDAIYGATNDYVMISGLDLRATTPGGIGYVAVEHRLSVSAYGNYLYSPGRLGGGVYDPTVGKFYIHDAGANQMRSMLASSVDTVNDFWLFEDTGQPPVNGDPSLLYGMVYDASRAMLWGVSGPGAGAQANPEIMGDAPLSGKYYLWQFANWLTDRVEIADFSEGEGESMDVWAALEELAGFVDGVFDFDETGAFYFKTRPLTGTPAMTITTLDLDLTNTIPGATVKKRSGAKKIFNVVEMSPSIAVLRPPEGTVRVLARPSTFVRPPWDAKPEVFQGNNRNLNVLLRCVKGGLSGAEDDGCVRKTATGKTLVDYSPSGSQTYHRLRFSYLLYDTVIETQVITFTPGSPTTVVIPYDAGKGVRSLDPAWDFALQNYPTADVLRIADTEEYKIRRVTLDAASGTATLLLDPLNFGPGWPTGTKCTLRLFGNARWSDDRVGITSNASSAGGSGSVGGISTMDFFSTREMAPGMVLRYETGEEVRVLTVLNSTQASVRRGINGTTPQWHVNIEPVQAFWAPGVVGDFPDGTRFGIGGTGVSMRFPDLPDTGDNPFMVGDTIDIVCPGLKLEEQSNAKIISYNTASIQKLSGNKIPWPQSRTSRFAGYRQCVEITRAISTNYGLPHTDLTVDMPMRWLPKINQAYLIQDPRTLPYTVGTSPNGDNPVVAPDTAIAIAALVESVSIDPINDRVTLELRAINPHAW